MLPSRPPLLIFDDPDPETAYRKAREEFERLYLSTPVTDVMGRRVVFEPEDCDHVCFKQVPGHDPHKRFPRDQWRADRAERIPWILTALTAPETRVRKSPVRQDEGRQSFVVIVPADSKLRLPQEFFGAFVRTLSNPDVVRFLTAYQLDSTTLDKVKNAGPQLYPPKPSKPKTGRNK